MKRNLFLFLDKSGASEDEPRYCGKHGIPPIDGRGTDNNQLMPGIKHQWQIAHAKRPCQLSKWYLRRVCIIQRAAISAAHIVKNARRSVARGSHGHTSRSEAGRREVCFLFYSGSPSRLSSESTWGITYSMTFRTYRDGLSISNMSDWKIPPGYTRELMRGLMRINLFSCTIILFSPRIQRCHVCDLCTKLILFSRNLNLSPL